MLPTVEGNHDNGLVGTRLLSLLKRSGSEDEKDVHSRDHR